MDWSRGKYPPNTAELQDLERAFSAARELVLPVSSIQALPLPERRRARVSMLRAQLGEHPCSALAGTVVLGSKAVDKLKSSREDPPTSDALSAIGVLLANAKFGYARRDESNDANLIDVVRLVCRVRTETGLVAIKLTVKRYSREGESPRLYALEVVGADPAV